LNIKGAIIKPQATKAIIEARKEAISNALIKDPRIPSKTLARRLCEETTLWPSIDSARDSVRYYRGEDGRKSRQRHGQPKPKRQVNTPIGNIVPEPDLPPEPVAPVSLKLKGYGTVISDVHIPYHDKIALVSALEHSEKAGAMDFLLINGDFMDFYGISRFNRNPSARMIKDELDMTIEILRQLRKRFKRVIYKMGNHERRWTSYLYANAPEIANLPCLSFQNIFKAAELDIEIVEPQQIMIVGRHFTILHGHEFNQSAYSPVNPARGAFLRAKNNVLIAHHHKPSEHVETDIRDKVTSTFSLGCLCNLNPPFSPINGWVHGFANMHVHNSDFEVENHRMTEGGKVR
jgi:predicted phosphodiesterase